MVNRKFLTASIFLLSTCCLFCTNNLFAKDILVANSTELNAAFKAAKPGDAIVMQNGNWTNIVIDFNATASEKSLITLRAQSSGKVILTGNSTLVFSKPYLVVDGLLFKQGALTKKDNAVISFNADNCRLTNTAIVDYNPADFNTEYYWIYFNGRHNRMDHCFFTGKNNMRPVVQNDEEGAKYNQIDHCYIKDIPFVKNANGREIMRIFGYGHADQMGEDGAYITIEYNLFDHAHGEGTEIVSLKSNYNIVRYNTVIASKGGLVGRRGKNNTFEGNIILGMGEQGSSGIRVAGPNHRVVNNYIADVAEDGIRLIAGEYYEKSLTPNFAPKKKNLPKYLQVQNGYFAHNTIISCGENGINVGFSYKNHWPDLQMVLFPENNHFINNLVYNVKENAINIEQIDKAAPLDVFNFKPNVFEANIAFGKNICNTTLPKGIKDIDPLVKLSTDCLYRLMMKSPAINNAVTSDVKDDVGGVIRDNKKDIGAEEYSNTKPNRKPLTPVEVGPDWMIKKKRLKNNHKK
jgi:poly(beta-D-mannuronate) lyase